MKKRVLIILVVLFVLFSGFFLYKGITGKIITSVNSCQDTDNGKVFSYKGEVFGIYYAFEKQDFRYEDKCLNEKKVMEYYCVKDGISSLQESIEYECKDKCEYGKCLNEGVVEEEKPCNLWCKIKKILI